MKFSRNYSMGLLLVFAFGCEASLQTCKEYYEGGQLEYEVPCYEEEGFEGKMIMYYEDGNRKAERYFSSGIETDTATYYYQDGEAVEKIIPMIDGLPNGIERYYYENGNLFKETTYKEGLLQGVYRIFNSQGQLELEGEYFNDLRWGPWMRYYPNGSPKSSFSFNSGFPYGAFVVYRENGLPYINGHINLGYLDGDVNYYNSEGAIIRKEKWVEGENVDFRPGKGLERNYPRGEAEFVIENVRISIDGEKVTIER